MENLHVVYRRLDELYLRISIYVLLVRCKKVSDFDFDFRFEKLHVGGKNRITWGSESVIDQSRGMFSSLAVAPAAPFALAAMLLHMIHTNRHYQYGC